MKVYLFYLIPIEEYCKDVPVLYAFTDDKEYANRFIKERNSNRFICKKINMSKKEFEDLMGNHYKLLLKEITLKSASKFIYGSFDKIVVLSNWNEEEFIYLSKDKLFTKLKYPDASVLKSKYIKALHTLLYFDFYKMQYIADHESLPFYEPYYNSYGPVDEFIIEEFKNKFEYDELELFIYRYGELFNLDRK